MSAAIIGIDPGLTGAVAVLDGSTFDIFDMPVLEISRNGKKRRELDVHLLADRLDVHLLADRLDVHLLADRLDGIGAATIEHAFLEQAWPRPTDSAVSGNKAGRCFGEVCGALAALQYRLRSLRHSAGKRNCRYRPIKTVLGYGLTADLITRASLALEETRWPR